jgi:hypothetical protein
MMTRRLQVLDGLPKLALVCLFWCGLFSLPGYAQVGPPPVINVHPLSQTVLLHGKVSFTVVASSSTMMTYQWRKNGIDIPGANSSTYTIERVEVFDQGAYSVKVTNAGGSTISNDATLTVLGMPVITTQPSDQMVIQGQPASFSVSVSGAAPFWYQWQLNGILLPNATNSTLTIPSVQPPDMGAYTVEVRNPYGAAISTPAMLQMEPVGFVIVVSNPDDSGPGSFRQALVNANANPGPHTIVFGIPGVAPFIINLLTPLPVITNPVTIDATTQPGFSDHPIVELNGSSGAGDGLVVTAGGSTIRGLAIHDFPGSGIVLAEGHGNVVQGNFIGAGSDGVTKQANALHGLMISNSAGNIIGGADHLTRNVVVTSGKNGIHIEGAGANHNRVIGNIVGLDWTGLLKLGVRGHGIVIADAAWNVIGGTNPGEGNVSAWNWFDGLVIEGSNACFNVVQGNLIGTDITGLKGAGGSGNAVTIRDAPSNTVGGLVLEAANVIAGHVGSGVLISGSVARFNDVQGNFIGTDRSGTLPLGNWRGGVCSVNSSNNTVGGLVPGAGNTIAFNREGAVIVDGGQCAIVGNSLYSNTGDEIGLLNGANNSVPPPVLTLASNDLTKTWFLGSLSNKPAAKVRVEFFASPGSAGDARTFLGFAHVATDADGVGLVDVVLTTGAITNQFVTATVTDAAGNTSPLSLPQAVEHACLPEIVLQPQSVSGLIGSSVSLSVSASGIPAPTYQWFFQGYAIARATRPNLDIEALTLEDAGNYFVVAMNSAGSVTSTVATVTVVAPPAITMQPQSQNVAPNQAVTMSVTATGTGPLSYQWTFNGAPLPLAQDASFTLQNVQLSDAGEYRVIVSNAAGSVSSDAAYLSVTNPQTISPFYLNSAEMTVSGFSFQFLLAPGFSYVVLASTNCQVWIPVATNVSQTGNVVFTDPDAANHAVRFYRVMAQ